MDIQGWASELLLLSLLGYAVVSDVRHHRIPNRLVLTGLALGLAGQAFAGGLGGLGQGMLGALIGFGLFLMLYAAGGMAAGDVKLMAMVGAFLTPQQALAAAAASLMVGGLCGLALMIWHGQLRQTLGRYALMLRSQSYLAPAAGEVAGRPFPYAIAILLGTCASSLWFHFD
ncbi:A24 family peptidase [Stutzerimonas frequens]|uniref:A24 family peptidase n=1 Tax=Stutzerimonas frequens TaxID=2968969 RepID=A0AA47E5B9_9GAMM|nr:A24 family peptidase [Stutzerimonas frequens]MCD1638470.1 A24 family peptidase [Stutzerimonas stutzeri]MDL0441811.1 A24 family peptidase [Stutzerimonas frequens]WAE54397.1 A24 family peptidase [Stutzerimonas frequens]WOC77369.1 A24 family peptidase [Stutzerimonas frequens]